MDSAKKDLLDTASVAGKYLTFALGSEVFGLEILKVREIIGIMSVRSIPRSHDYLKGVINLRGNVIPVADLRLKFQMEEASYTDQTCIVVVRIGQIDVGVIVDQVLEVLDISEEQIEPCPSFGSGASADYIIGMGKIGDSVKILLDIETVLAASEVAEIKGLADESAGQEEKDDA